MMPFRVNLDRRRVSGNAPGQIATGGSTMVERAGLRRLGLFKDIARQVGDAEKRQRIQSDNLRMVELLGTWDAGLSEGLRTLDAGAADYREQASELVSGITELAREDWATSEGYAAAERAAASFRNSAAAQAFETAERTLEERRRAVRGKALSTALNRIYEDPDGFAEEAANFTLLAGEAAPVEQARTDEALLSARVQGYYAAGRYREGAEALREGVSLLSAPEYRRLSRDAALAAEKAAHRVIEKDLALIDAGLDEERGDLAVRLMSLEGTRAKLYRMISADAVGPHMGKATSVLKRVVGKLEDSRKDAVAIRLYEGASGAGLGKDNVDRVFKVLSRQAERPLDIGVEVASRTGRLPTPLRAMFAGAGPRSGEPAKDAPVVAGLARAKRRMAERGVTGLPENRFVDAALAYADTMGVSETEAAEWALASAPDAATAEARRDLFRRGGVEDLDLRKAAVVRALGEDILDVSMWSDPEVGAAFMADARSVFEDAYALTGEPDMARKIGERRLKGMWGVSSMTGRTMKRPPERYLPLHLGELHSGPGEALRVLFLEDMEFSGLEVPLSLDAELVERGGVEYRQNSEDWPFRLVWTAESEERFRETGAAQYDVHVRTAHGVFAPAMAADGAVMQWRVPQTEAEMRFLAPVTEQEFRQSNRPPDRAGLEWRSRERAAEAYLRARRPVGLEEDFEPPTDDIPPARQPPEEDFEPPTDRAARQPPEEDFEPPTDDIPPARQPPEEDFEPPTDRIPASLRPAGLEERAGLLREARRFFTEQEERREDIRELMRTEAQASASRPENLLEAAALTPAGTSWVPTGTEGFEGVEFLGGYQEFMFNLARHESAHGAKPLGDCIIKKGACTWDKKPQSFGRYHTQVASFVGFKNGVPNGFDVADEMGIEYKERSFREAARLIMEHPDLEDRMANMMMNAIYRRTNGGVHHSKRSETRPLVLMVIAWNAGLGFASGGWDGSWEGLKEPTQTHLESTLGLSKEDFQ